ncbi:hypothetical protein HZS_6770, partial [Henneguya salminicola]
VFGKAYILRPTMNIELKWDTLEKNRNLFLSLNINLKDQQQILVLKGVINSIISYFVIFSSSTETMLLKQIAANQMFLNDIFISKFNPKIPEKDLIFISSLLTKKKYCENLNPCDLKTNIYEVILQSTPKRKSKPITDKSDVKHRKLFDLKTILL